MTQFDNLSPGSIWIRALDIYVVGVDSAAYICREGTLATSNQTKTPVKYVIET